MSMLNKNNVSELNTKIPRRQKRNKLTGNRGIRLSNTVRG
jgi:hypothetical protein